MRLSGQIIEKTRHPCLTETQRAVDPATRESTLQICVSHWLSIDAVYQAVYEELEYTTHHWLRERRRGILSLHPQESEP